MLSESYAREKFLEYFKQLGGPKLLPVRSKGAHDPAVVIEATQVSA